MLQFGQFAFTAPWILTALAALPVLWWLLRITPPAPRIQAFPPLRLLLSLRRQEETPARTPIWLIILRMLIAALIIFGLAHPLFDPGARLMGSGPLVLAIDDGWASAPRWGERKAVIDALIDQAERENRAVIVLTTAPERAGAPVRASGLLRAAEARRVVRTVKPKPWPVDRKGALAAVGNMTLKGSAHVAWLSDGLDGASAAGFAERLQALGVLQVFKGAPHSLARLLQAPDADRNSLTIPVVRAAPQGETSLWLRAIADDGRLLGRGKVAFGVGKTRAELRFALPGEMRNMVARIEIEGEQSAGAVFLMDERWRRRPVGIASGEAAEAAQPLLSDIYYLKRALQPFSDVHSGTISALLKRKLAVLLLADIGKLSGGETERLGEWIAEGGIVVRFAGPRLAKNADALIPVRLRGGGRALGGALSWTKPAGLLPFAETGPFAGLKVAEDVRIRRQVLAEPTLDLNDKTWARLADGTPLVTAVKRGHGWLILVHTTANTEWSNLPISGMFIEMLQRIVGLSQGIVGDDSETVFPPLELLDGFGALGAPPSTAVAIPGRGFSDIRAGPRHPPGYYGRGDARRAVNLSHGIERLVSLAELPPGIEVASYARKSGIDFKPWLLLAALALILADLIISYALRGLVPAVAAGRAATAALVLAAALAAATAPLPAQAQTVQIQMPPAQLAPETGPPTGKDAYALKATLNTRLAYVRTGDSRIDGISRAGLLGLSLALRQRTAVEPEAPMEVDIERDELAFFPLLYWPVTPSQRPPSDRAVEKLNQYLRSGGTILFDTREQGTVSFDLLDSGGPATSHLRLLMSGLDIPTLIPVPNDHVLTKSFYLLNDFPGRWSGGVVWVERRGGHHNDGVSSVIIGANDWAAAWATDYTGTPILPVVPGGNRQREFAYRFGVNWVMYALTGNYKTDQVHAPAIIERLGQ